MSTVLIGGCCVAAMVWITTNDTEAAAIMLATAAFLIKGEK